MREILHPRPGLVGSCGNRIDAKVRGARDRCHHRVVRRATPTYGQAAGGSFPWRWTSTMLSARRPRTATAFKPHGQPTGLLAGSLDLLAMILKNAPIHIVNAVYNGCIDSVIRIILKSDDHGELQNATECLAAFVCWGKQELLA